MVQSEVHKGNIGEWSELYTLGYLLVHGGAYAADENQNAIPDIFHRVLQVHLAEKMQSPSKLISRQQTQMRMMKTMKQNQQKL